MPNPQRASRTEAQQPPVVPALEGTVYIVEDDREIREYVAWLVKSAGWRVEIYNDAAAFLAAYVEAGAACLVTDLRLPGLSGLDLQEELAARRLDLPIIMMSAYAEVSTAVRALRGGALDFLQKPFDGQTLLERVRTALLASATRQRHRAERAAAARAIERLTPRQRTVLDGLLDGKSSKVMAAELGVSPQTIDVHRFRLMRALGAQSLPDLFRLVVLVSDEGAPPRRSAHSPVP